MKTSPFMVIRPAQRTGAASLSRILAGVCGDQVTLADSLRCLPSSLSFDQGSPDPEAVAAAPKRLAQDQIYAPKEIPSAGRMSRAYHLLSPCLLRLTA
jgi:hypothetical protein